MGQAPCNDVQMPDPKLGTQSAWKTFLDFLWDGGYRSTIVFSVTLGAIVITVGSDKFCRAMPPELPQSVAPMSQGQNPKALILGATQQPTVVVAQPNPICAKYFELAFMVVGGYLGLAMPKGSRTPSRPSDFSGTDGDGEPANGIERPPTDSQSPPSNQTGRGSRAEPVEPNESGSKLFGAVRVRPSPVEGVSGGGDARVQPADPDKPEPGFQ